MKFAMFSSLILVALAFGCDSSSSVSELPAERSKSARPISSQTVDVFADEIAAAKAAPNKRGSDNSNILSNPNFDDGIAGWTACSGGSANVTTNPDTGKSTMLLSPGTCVYQLVEVNPNEKHFLHCTIRLTEGRSWTGMGMTVSNANYEILAESRGATFTSETYLTQKTSVRTPDGSSSIGVWIHTDHGATVDSCSLSAGSAATTPNDPEKDLSDKEPPTGRLSHITTDGTTATWVSGCGGDATPDGNGITIAGSTCVDQSLLADSLSTLTTTSMIFSCNVGTVVGYSDITAFLDGEIVVSREITEEDTNKRIELEIPAMAADNGFIALYSEGNLNFSDCALESTNEAPTQNIEWGNCKCVGEDNGQLRVWSEFFGTAYPTGPLPDTVARIFEYPLDNLGFQSINIDIYETPMLGDNSITWITTLQADTFGGANMHCSNFLANGDIQSSAIDLGPLDVTDLSAVLDLEQKAHEDCSAGLYELYSNHLLP